ncbi:MAG TPA: hypothetical protein VFZ09_02960 [Archangium sp.]|uniref:hypothetical protein n=1 Tax=Archangium sp. TaxID=1872627 RepID=UPI002E344E2D|nr:hypothetical protein [Archangium sp.]HEX5745174.1 hypothetical protein [Archangium sp.]
MPLFTMCGHDNDLSFFKDRNDVKRCSSCGLLVAKWKENLSVVSVPRRLRYDVSSSYDGVVVVSQRFRDVYERTGLTGLEFTPLTGGYFALRATHTVVFDSARRGTRFVKKCDACGQYESVAGAAPAFLVDGEAIGELAFARTDLEFGSGDERAPVFVCGARAAEALRGAKLKGMDLEKVEGT